MPTSNNMNRFSLIVSVIGLAILAALASAQIANSKPDTFNTLIVLSEIHS